MKNTATTQRSSAAFTLVEVMMAAVILTVGFMGLIQAVTVCSGMMDQARRQTLAAQILNNEIEKLRLLPWSDSASTNDIVDLPAGPTSITIDPQFDIARASLGDNQTASASVAFSLTRTASTIAANLREVNFTLTWVVKSSRRDNFGNPVTFSYTRSNSAWYGRYGLNLTYRRS